MVDARFCARDMLCKLACQTQSLPYAEGLEDQRRTRKKGRETTRVYRSDITNTQVGISGETVPEGGNLHIY